MTFELAFDPQSHIQGQGTGYRISCTNYVSARAKMIANDSWLHWTDYTTMTFDLAFDLQFDLEGQKLGHRSSLCKLSRRVSCRLRYFGMRAYDNFGTIFGTPLFGVEFNL